MIDQLYNNKYQDHGYIPMKSSEADSYRRYMQYHLRNNIIEILSKKSGNNLGEFQNQRKFSHMTTSQKLITKRPESAAQSKENSKVHDINRTFR